MSRTLSKVLTICALVVMISLTIAGTALAAYHSIENTIVIEALFMNGEEADKDSDGYAYVSYNGKANSKLNVKASHLVSVDLGVDYNKVAYTFEGWFEGDKLDYDLANKNGEVKLVKDEDIKVKMDGPEHYLAVFSVTKYKIGQWLKLDADATPEGAKDVYVYGEKLPEPEFDGENAEHFHFRGWQVVAEPEMGADATETIEFYPTATFAHEGLEKDVETGAYSVYGLSYTNSADKETGSFVEDSKFTVTYNGLNAETKVDVYENDTCELKTPAAESEYTKENGYKYSWKAADGTLYNFGETVTISSDMTFTLEKIAIEYTATLLDKTGSLADGQTVGDIKFSVEGDETETYPSEKTLQDWIKQITGLETKHAYWEIVGVKFNDSEYTAESQFSDFIEAFAETNPDTTATAEFELNVTKHFTSLTFTAVDYLAFDESDGTYSKEVYSSNEYNFGFNKDSRTLNEDGDYNKTLDVLLGFYNGAFAKVSNDEYTPVKCVSISINFGEDSRVLESEDFDIETNNVYEFLDALYKLYQDKMNEVEDSMTFAKITFNFDVV